MIRDEFRLQFDDPERELQYEKTLHAIAYRGREEAHDRMKRIAEALESFRDVGMISGEMLFRTLYPLLWEYMPDGWGQPDWMDAE